MIDARMLKRLACHTTRPGQEEEEVEEAIVLVPTTQATISLLLTIIREEAITTETKEATVTTKTTIKTNLKTISSHEAEDIEAISEELADITRVRSMRAIHMIKISSRKTRDISLPQWRPVARILAPELCPELQHEGLEEPTSSSSSKSERGNCPIM